LNVEFTNLNENNYFYADRLHSCEITLPCSLKACCNILTCAIWKFSSESFKSDGVPKQFGMNVFM